MLTDKEKESFIQIIDFENTYTLCFFTQQENQGLGFKGHEVYHIMMQKILRLCMWHLMIKECRMAIICLCWVFKRLCAKVVDSTVMGDLKKEVAITLALLE